MIGRDWTGKSREQSSNLSRLSLWLPVGLSWLSLYGICNSQANCRITIGTNTIIAKKHTPLKVLDIIQQRKCLANIDYLNGIEQFREGVMMKQLCFIVLAMTVAGLGAMVNFGDDYIGSGDMGMFRKTRRTQSNSNYGSEPSSYTTQYYYNSEIPTQIDSILSGGSTGPYGGGSVSRLYYYHYTDYYKVVEEKWSWNFDNTQMMYNGSITSHYNLLDQITLEIYELSYDQRRNEYYYNDQGKITTFKEFYPYYSSSSPYRITTYSYDDQSRLTFTVMLQEDQIALQGWQSWSLHSQPDSTYTYTPMASGTKHFITLNLFDDNDEIIHQKNFRKVSLSNANWSRTDYLYSYVTVEGINFPLQRTTRTGNVANTTVEFVPSYEYTSNYSYTGGYHNVFFFDGNAHNTFSYNANWLLTGSNRNDESGNNGVSQIWEYYGPVDNNDPIAPQLSAEDWKISVFPNPCSRGTAMLSIELQGKSYSKAGHYSYELYNLRGQKLQEGQLNHAIILQRSFGLDLDDICSGIYQIRLLMDGGVKTCKRIVLY